MLKIGRGPALAMAIVLGGCGTLDNVAGLPPTPERLSANAMASAQLETRYIEALSVRAGLGGAMPATTSADWRLIQRAGIRDIDSRCDEYLDALFRFNRQQQAVRQGITATAATTGTILSIVRAASSAFGIVTAAFGLSASLFDAGANSVLFTIEPSALRNVVLEGRDKYAALMDKHPPSTRPDTMIQLQGYLAQCSPATIEANINLAANGSRNAVTHFDDRSALNAARLAGAAIAPAALAPASTQSPQDQARRDVARGVRGGPQGPVIPQGDPDIRPVEVAARITATDVKSAQVMLGLPITGLMGPHRDGQTNSMRFAIMEFERGMQVRDDGWSTTGNLAGKTYDTLVGASSPMPPALKSPFERALLTNLPGRSTDKPFTALDLASVRAVWIRTARSDPPADLNAEQLLEKLRPMFAARRQLERLGSGNHLDAQLWEVIKRQ